MVAGVWVMETVHEWMVVLGKWEWCYGERHSWKGSSVGSEGLLRAIHELGLDLMRMRNGTERK